MFCYHRFVLLVIIQALVLLLKLGNAQKQDMGNDEALPFRLKHNGTMVEFPSIPSLKGVSLGVAKIDYENHTLSIYDPQNCLPRLFLQLYNTPHFPFQFCSYDYDYSSERCDDHIDITFFNCSSAGSRIMHSPCSPNTSVCPIYVVDSDQSILTEDLVSCTKMVTLSSPIWATELEDNDGFRLKWWPPKNGDEKHRKMLISLAATGSMTLLMLFILCFYIYGYFQKKADDQVRLEKFLEDYKVFKPTRFSYVDLKRITSNFKYKLGEGAHGTIFKGNLSAQIQVAVKVLNNSDSNDGKDFINEMGTMGKIHHVNVVRLLGFCADGFRRALIYDFFPNGSLQKFISSPDNEEKFLGWQKLHQIALAIAKGIEYLHQGCDHRILHFDINPRNMLLDHNFTPKISDFGLAKLCSKNHSMVSITVAKGTVGYIAPELFSRNFGNVSYKSDIYSYGVLLLEIVCGRKNVDTNQETLQVLYPEWIYDLIEDKAITIYMEDDEDGIKIAKKLAIVRLWCIQWHPTNRPSIKTVIQMLEGEAEKLKVPPTPFDFPASTNTNTIIPARRLNFGLEIIAELE